MKKDKEWAKKEIKKIHALTFDAYEAAVIANNKHFQMKNSEQLALINKVMEILNQLDEPEVLTQEWIDEHEIHYNHWVGAVPVTELQNLLVPKQELPIIPQFVAEFLIGKEDYMLYELFDDEWLYEEHDRVAKWLYDNDELTNKQREIDLVMARDRGYTVEEEQKYYVVLEENDFGAVGLGGGIDGSLTFAATDSINGLSKLTEQEIKDYDERYWPFAVKAEELEE